MVVSLSFFFGVCGWVSMGWFWWWRARGLIGDVGIFLYVGLAGGVRCAVTDVEFQFLGLLEGEKSHFRQLLYGRFVFDSIRWEEFLMCENC